MTNSIVLAAVIMTASWERRADYGRIMADGNKYTPFKMTCAARQFPLGSVIRVTDIHNGSSVVVTVTDRPARKYSDRVDLSPLAFSHLNGLELGLCTVRVTQE